VEAVIEERYFEIVDRIQNDRIRQHSQQICEGCAASELITFLAYLVSKTFLDKFALGGKRVRRPTFKANSINSFLCIIIGYPN